MALEKTRQILSHGLTAAAPAISSVLFSEFRLCRSFIDDLENLKQMKLFLEWRLLHLEDMSLQRQLSGPQGGSDRLFLRCITEVIKTLRCIIYDIDDIINEYYSSKEKKNFFAKVSSWFSMSNPMISRYGLVRKVDSLGVELRRIQVLILSIESTMNSMPQHIFLYPRRASAVIQRSDDYHKILDLIVQEDCYKNGIIAIVGPPGSVKTTLLREIFCDAQIEHKFTRIWVDLATRTEANPEVICKEIMMILGEAIDDNLLLMTELCKVLHKNACLIVLDGLLGSYQAIAELKEILITAQGAVSKIVVTTQSKKVAAMIATVDPYCLPALSREACDVIIQNTMRFVDDELFMENHELIAARCNGIPLVAEFIGSVLATGPGTPQIWKLAKGEELWKIEADFPTVPPLLHTYKLLYYRMPQNMRLCFVYCSIFFKASAIKRKKSHSTMVGT